VRGRDVERLLELVAEIEGARAALHRSRVLLAEVERDERVVREAPRVASAAAAHAPPVEGIARALESQWVAQGPLVAEWQRAADLVELALGSGVDAGEYRGGVDAARRAVEAARLETREVAERLARERTGIEGELAAAPFDLPELPPARADGRPESARRDALALLALIEGVREAAAEAEGAARVQLESARAELDAIGEPAQLERRLAELQERLPDHVALPGSTPPSVGIRLERAGIHVERA
jgi:hypothetical protein